MIHLNYPLLSLILLLASLGYHCCNRNVETSNLYADLPNSDDLELSLVGNDQVKSRYKVFEKESDDIPNLIADLPNSDDFELSLVGTDPPTKSRYKVGEKESDDITIVGTADGYVHAIDSQNNMKWSASTGGSIASSHHNLGQNAKDREYSIIPSIDGSLLVHSSLGGMRKTSVKARMLVEKTPFMSEDGDLIFTGQRKSKILGLDVDSGFITHEINIDSGEVVSKQKNEAIISQEVPLWIGRVDYTLRAYDGLSGIEQFNFSYSEVKPLSSSRIQSKEDLILQNHKLNSQSLSLRKDHSHLPRLTQNSLTSPKKSKLYSSSDGLIFLSDEEKELVAAYKLASPAVSAFKINKFKTNDIHIEDIGVIYKDSDSSEITTNSAVEIRTNSQGGLYAVDVPKDFDSLRLLNGDLSIEDFCQQNAVACTSDFLLLDSTKSRSRNVGAKITGPQKIPLTSLTIPKKPKGSTDLISKISQDTLDRKSKCSNYPKEFKDVNSIENDALELLTTSQSVSSTMCLVGHHEVVLGNNNLPFLDDLDLETPSQSEEKPTPKTTRVLNGRFLLLGLISMFWFLSSRNSLDSYRKLLKKWLIYWNILEPDEVVNIPTLQSTVAINQENQRSQLREDFDEFGRKFTKIGSLVIFDKILGHGSQGTVVFLGHLNSRPVAIKRMLLQFSCVAEREMSLLIRSDGHPNVVRYFLNETHGEFVYLALQLCCMSLRDFVQRVASSRNASLEASKAHDSNIDDSKSLETPNNMFTDDVRHGLLQIAKGVAHLHSQRIIHRDLKPHNILCALPDEKMLNEDETFTDLSQLNDFVLKISDMGLSKQFDKDESFAMPSFMNSCDSSKGDNGKTNDEDDGRVGTIGWQAPELVALRNSGLSPLIVETEEENQRNASSAKLKGESVDVFSLGCIFHYVLIPCEHPFGQWFERENNILNDKSDLSKLSSHYDAFDLISRMLNSNPTKRPTATQVYKHPFFWTFQYRLDFMVELSDRLEHEEAHSSLVLAIESNAAEIIGSSWDRRLHSSLLEDIGKYRKYDKSCVRDLLRLIRNKRHHFHELDEELKIAMSPMPTGFVTYFETRFPKLLLHCVKVACLYLSKDSSFSSACENIYSIFYENKIVPLVSEELISISSNQNDLEESSQSINVTNITNVLNTPSIKDENILSDQNVIVWYGGALAEKFQCRGWFRDSVMWENGTKFGSIKQMKSRPSHVTKASTDFRYRTRLCTHWENNQGTLCPMRKKVL